MIWNLADKGAQVAVPVVGVENLNLKLFPIGNEKFGSISIPLDEVTGMLGFGMLYIEDGDQLGDKVRSGHKI